jgi:hypothetical protein
MSDTPESAAPADEKSIPRESFKEVPSDVSPPGDLPPLRERDLPEPVPLVQMIGPSIILAGLALGSGEYILWPYITFRSGFVFFWAALLGVAVQYVINMEVMRWTLATGESAMTGFMRLSRHFAWLFLILNILPWMLPAWAQGAGKILSWIIWHPAHVEAAKNPPLDILFAIVGVLGCGVLLSAGSVIYETVEKAQFVLVGTVVVIVVALAAWLSWLRPDAIHVQFAEVITLGRGELLPQLDPPGGHLTPMLLLGALAFAGVGGTLNLGQSNYIKDKGYGMGAFIGRITSPLTGNEEPISELGYLFPLSEENLARWQAWWRNAGWEHFLSFFCTCWITLILLALIAYICFFDQHGNPMVKGTGTDKEFGFLFEQVTRLNELVGPVAHYAFLVMGVAILFSTELGVLDAVSRISTDIIKVAWLRENTAWSESRLYLYILWAMIACCIGILLLNLPALKLFTLVASLNGGVMAIYCGTLIWLNTRYLPEPLRMSWWRLVVMFGACGFYGFFAVWTVWYLLT